MATQNEMINNLKGFCQTSSKDPDFSLLRWDKCLAEFKDPISFEIEIRSESNDAVNDFLELSVTFSCLLQADGGSFSASTSSQNQTNFSLNIDTSKLIDTKSKLSPARDTIQKQLLTSFECDKPVVVINAPTGSGKTKVFLDLINRYKSDNKKLE